VSRAFGEALYLPSGDQDRPRLAAVAERFHLPHSAASQPWTGGRTHHALAAHRSGSSNSAGAEMRTRTEPVTGTGRWQLNAQSEGPASPASSAPEYTNRCPGRLSARGAWSHFLFNELSCRKVRVESALNAVPLRTGRPASSWWIALLRRTAASALVTLRIEQCSIRNCGRCNVQLW
jgi:hypothetical protein